jgi:hypothetical protein
MCTVVCRWSAGERFPVQLLALRDEFAGRAFDLPDAWWPAQPRVVGGRDRRGGGSWCVSDIATGVTAVVLNRPERPAAAPGASSRGVLPLLAALHRERWPEFVDITPMASFNLVVAAPGSLLSWSFDGQQLQSQSLPVGTHMFTPRGVASSFDLRFAAGRGRFADDLSGPTEQVWSEWLAVVRESVPGVDPGDLLVRRPMGDDIFETVFGQFIAGRPGALRLDYLTHPEFDLPWTTKFWRTG